MFAVIKTGGKQYRVAAEQVLKIDRIAAEVGDIVQIGNVLAHGEGDKVTIGTPFVDGASVAAEVVEQGRNETVIAFKKRRRQNSRRKRGQRQLMTIVRISEILLDGAKPSKKAAPKKETAEPKAAKESAAASAADAAAGINDDVSLISGVGPTLKKKLADAGITSLKQIAELSADDAGKLDTDLSLGGRIERDEWIEQAKELLAGKPPRAKVDKAAAAEDKDEA
jgi:large subunit ribosomal protein L21